MRGNIGHVMIKFFFFERENLKMAETWKQKTSKEFQNDMAMACIVLSCTQNFFLSPSTKIYFSISGSSKKISAMAVALWFHVASFRHQQHQKLYSHCCVYTFLWQALLKLYCFLFFESKLMWKLSEMRMKVKKVWKFQKKKILKILEN